MKLLIDTHILIWWETEPLRLPPTIVKELNDPSNEIFISVVSFWEIIIKIPTGKIQFDRNLRELAKEQMVNGLALLAVTFDHIEAIQNLPMIHKDPFDRLLIAQAIAEGATLVSADGVFHQYPVPVLW